MRLIGISMVKNEADIIEPFVRHNLRFLDGFLILDHSSFDGTREILVSMVQEGLPLWISDNPRLEYNQSVEMTRLCRQAFREHSPDFVIPLDADELLGVRSREDLEKALLALPPDCHGLIGWQTYVPMEHDPVDEKNPVLRITHRRRTERPQYFKVAVSASFSRLNNLLLNQGNHAVSDSTEKVVPHAVMSGVRIAHFPVRSCDQIVAKVVAGVVGYILLGSGASRTTGMGYQWYQLYNEIIEKGRISPADLHGMGLNYAAEEEYATGDVVHDPFPLSVNSMYAGLGTQDPVILLAKLATNTAVYFDEARIQYQSVPQQESLRNELKTGIRAAKRSLQIVANRVIPRVKRAAESTANWVRLHIEKERIKKSGLFNTHWYLKQNPDVLAAGLDPILHYLQNGAGEGRDPSPLFDTNAYVDRFMDGHDGLNPLIHFSRSRTSAVPAAYRSTEELRQIQDRYFSSIKTEFLQNRILQKRRNLVFLRCGMGSVHKIWFLDKPRSWDLMLSCYDSTHVDDPCADVSFLQKGTKFTSALTTQVQFPELFQDYDYIFLLDDDIHVQFEDIDKLFATCRESALDLAQPSLTADSHGAWPDLFQQGGSPLRYVGSVEIMMPVFCARAFQLCIPHFREAISGWGLDLVWSHLLDAHRKRNIAVIDSIACRHSKPIDTKSGAYYSHLHESFINPRIELNVILDKYDIPKELQQVGMPI